MARIAAIGEVMVELAPYPTAQEEQREVMALGFAGDTFNTSVYMARLGTQAEYVTILGDDPYSDQIIARAEAEKIGTSMIQRLPGRSPGLYIIRNTPDGEREFFYWRKEAPARELFSNDAAAANLAKQLAGVDCVYLSGITLAIISETARITLGYLLKELRSEGVTVAFDSNFRPRLWQSKEAAQQAMLSVLQHTDIALLTLDDEKLLWGDDSIEGATKRYADLSLKELVLKRGAEDSIIIRDGKQERVPVPPVKNVIDTTGAGDTFNAGYLSARLNGAEPADAAKEGTRCAGIVIRHRGGVIDKAIFEDEYKG
jgi:2-dehydro-3-deoxygluconokinase